MSPKTEDKLVAGFCLSVLGVGAVLLMYTFFSLLEMMATAVSTL